MGSQASMSSIQSSASAAYSESNIMVLHALAYMSNCLQMLGGPELLLSL